MASAKDLVAAVRSRKAPGTEAESAQAYWKRQREQWIADLAGLREQVKAWLAPVIDAQAAETKDVDFSLLEPEIGAYQAPGLEVRLLAEPAQVVTLRPRGMGVMGAGMAHRAAADEPSGRVDVECGVRRAILLRLHGDGVSRWCTFGDGTERELDEELFIDLLFETAEIEHIE